MNMLSTFFRTLIKSSTSPAYYNSVVRAPMWFSWKYFLALNLLVAIITGLQLLIPIALFDAVTQVSSISSIFPADLVIKGDQDGLHVNQELPYTIQFPGEMKEEMDDPEVPVNAVTFTSDEAIQGHDSIQALDSLFVLTSSTVYVMSDDETQEIKQYPIPDFEEPFTVDRGIIDGYITKIVEHPIIKYKLYIPLLFMAVLVFIFPAVLIARVIGLVVFSTVAWIITTIFMKAKGLSWSNVFQISIHSITPMILIGNVLGFLSLIFFTGWVYFLAYLFWTLFVISHLGKTAKVVEGEVVYKPAQPKAATKKSPVKKAKKK